MKDNRYQQLFEKVVCGGHWPTDSKTSEEEKALINAGATRSEAKEMRSSWEYDFGPAKLEDAINELDTLSSNQMLKRFQVRLYLNKNDPKVFEIPIKTPDDIIRIYSVELCWTAIYDFLDEDKSIDFLLEKKGVPRNTADVDVPTNVVRSLIPWHAQPVVFVPIGDISYNNEVTDFTLVRLLYTRQLGLIYNYVKCEEDMRERRGSFYGVAGEMSLAVLTGNFKIEQHSGHARSNCLKLEVLSRDGFKIQDAGRLDGEIQMLESDTPSL